VDVVFSHANGYNARTYRTILAPLAGGLRVLALDLRGHGATTLPTPADRRDGWNDLRDDLVALMAAVCQAPVILAGHSMGGTTSLLAAVAAPERVRALALFDPVIVPARAGGGAVAAANSAMVQGALRRRATFPSRAAAFEAYRGRGGFKTWSDVQVADYVAGGFVDTPDGQVTLACAPEWEASNFLHHHVGGLAAFDATRCPISLLRAEDGAAAHLEGQAARLAATGRIAIETVPGTTHFLPMERPDVVVEAIRQVADA
jgi:pimeloyl-ACP methyl ester carboxylesterase